MACKDGFTLVELMVTILIVAILAAAIIPSMQGRIDKAKWSEANATAGAIRRAVRVYASETDVATAQTLAGTNLSDPAAQEVLGLGPSDLEGTYFTAANYTITSVDASAVAVITVEGTEANAPSGTYQLTADGHWVKLGQGGGAESGGGDGGDDDGSGGGSGGSGGGDGGGGGGDGGGGNGGAGQSRGRGRRPGPAGR